MGPSIPPLFVEAGHSDQECQTAHRIRPAHRTERYSPQSLESE